MRRKETARLKRWCATAEDESVAAGRLAKAQADTIATLEATCAGNFPILDKPHKSIV